MHDFKVGDKVQVVRGVKDYASLMLGSVHTVYGVHVEDGYKYVYLSEEDKHIMKGWDANRFVKYEEKEKTVNKIEIGKKYRFVGTHEPVRIICVDRNDPEYPVVGLYQKRGYEGVMCFSSVGADICGGVEIEEIPAVGWSKVKVDTPIWVRFSNDWHKRHFHKVCGRSVYFWPGGQTSFTYNGPATYNNNFVDIEDCSLEEPK